MTLQNQLALEAKALPPQQLREALDFVRFLRLSRRFDAQQAYFWTKKWQAKEKAVEKSKKHGKVIGDGSMRSLARSLGK
ncbi:MAG: hypothetical protein AABZ44_01045 [Elusimicrobiota bacterium]